MVTIKFMPHEKEVVIPPGHSLFLAAIAADIPIESNCGGKGTCGKCKVRIISGARGKPTITEMKHFSEEELATGWALACQSTAQEDMIVEVYTQKDAFSRKVSLQTQIPTELTNPSVNKVFLKIAPPSVTDQTPDFERLLRHLPGLDISADWKVLAGLPRILRNADFQVTTVLVGNHLVAVEPGDTTGRQFGLALDIGTTTVVGSLLDLNSGKTIATSAVTNPQNIFGADVISRINHASQGLDNLKQLQEKIIGAINGISGELLSKSNVWHNEVYEAVVVGNTTMSHLFLGLDPSFLAPAPFVPVFAQSLEIVAEQLGVKIHQNGRVVVLPNIAGYVGSDTVGVMLATQIDRRKGLCLAVDIGTNGEMALAHEGRILTCSTAAGPAFEGAHIKQGMRAAEGAIESVSIDGDVKLEVIGNVLPRGICGSGLIDAVAEMLRAGIIDPSGMFHKSDSDAIGLNYLLQERIRRGENGYEFVLAPRIFSGINEDIVITQMDIQELLLAKGAIYAGIQVLLKEMGTTECEITEILLAGAFGNYIKKESALAIGLLPKLPLNHIHSIGNAAHDGAKLTLVSKTERARALSLAHRAEHIELSTRPDFTEEFINALSFPIIEPTF